MTTSDARERWHANVDADRRFVHEMEEEITRRHRARLEAARDALRAEVAAAREEIRARPGFDLWPQWRWRHPPGGLVEHGRVHLGAIHPTYDLRTGERR